MPDPRPARRRPDAGAGGRQRTGAPGRFRRLAARARRAVDALAVEAAPALRAARGFGADRVQLRAAALTYLTVVSLVPFLAVVLWGLQARDVFQVSEAVRDFVYENLAIGAREAIEPHLDRLISNASRAGSVRIGFLLLIGSALLLLRNVERAFDDLWGVGRRRPLSRQLPRYLGVLFAGPTALGLSLAVTTAFRTAVELYRLPFAGVIGALLPLALSVLGFSALYLLAPPARVRPKAALGGALVAAVGWEVAKVVYAAYAARAVESDVVYGPLSALPLFLVWIYVSWLITLFGARMAFALQHPRELLAGDERYTTRARELATARVAVALARVEEPAAAPTLHRLARDLRLPEATVRVAVGHLEDAGLVRVAGRRPSLARPPATIELREVIGAVRGEVRPLERGADSTASEVAALLLRADESALSSLAGLDLASVAAAKGPGAPPPAGPPLAKA